MKLFTILTCIFIVIFVLITLFIIFAPQLGAKSTGVYLERIKKSREYVGDHFENSPLAKQEKPAPGFKVLRELFFGAKDKKPKEKLPSSLVTFDKNDGNYLTWFGHSTFLYEVGEKKILFDPMLGMYASPIPGIIKRYDYDLPSSVEDLPYLDAVIISHDHYDHLDYKTVLALKEKVGFFIAPLGVGAHLRRWGISDEQIKEVDWHDEVTLGTSTEAVKITSVPSQHFSGRSINDRQASLWSAFIIQSKDAKVFFGGDSGYFDGFKKIGEKYGPFDLTLLDSGQYNEAWSIVHMFPEQSVQAHKDLQGKVFMPIHWSAFTLSIHPWKEPAEKAFIAAQKESIDMITPMIGQRFNVLTEKPKETWWRDIK